jgi:uncharacterized protein
MSTQSDHSAASVIGFWGAERGYLANRMYLMETEPNGDLDAVYASLPPHLEYWVELEKRGVLFAGGPRLPRDESKDWLGVGMVIFRAASLEEAERIAADDPMHLSGARRYTVTPWLLNHLRV